MNDDTEANLMTYDSKFKHVISTLALGCTLTSSVFAQTEVSATSNLENKTVTIVKADQPQTQYPWAKEFTNVEFGPYKVQVPKDGYYDRYKMHPDLNEVAKDPKVGNVDFFRKIPKQQVETRVGKVWSPNYYYRTSNVQLLMLAPLDKLKAKLPAQIEPLRVLPGYGLVSLTFFAYDVCDNDPDDEVSVAVVVRRPDAKGSQLKELINSIRNRDYYGHVLALPVDTEIARVRGVYGYSLPKWLTAIDLKIDDRIQADLYDTHGNIDVSLRAPTPKLKTVKNESHLEKKTMLNQVDGVWYSSYVQANNLTFNQDFFPSNVELTRAGGPVSKLLDQLGAHKILRLDVVKDAQLALHMPKPIDAWNTQTSK
jgi:hypothetical protein